MEKQAEGGASMAFGTKTNERPGTRASVRYLRVSAYKAREVLDLIRGLHVDDADGVLEFTDRAVATDIRKVLASAVANAEKNDEIDPNELYVSACYADEGPTLKRWRPRARGRATRIRKRTCHITIIVSRMDARAARAAPGPHRGRRRPRAACAATPPRPAAPASPRARPPAPSASTTTITTTRAPTTPTTRTATSSRSRSTRPPRSPASPPRRPSRAEEAGRRRRT